MNEEPRFEDEPKLYGLPWVLMVGGCIAIWVCVLWAIFGNGWG